MSERSRHEELGRSGDEESVHPGAGDCGVCMVNPNLLAFGDGVRRQLGGGNVGPVSISRVGSLGPVSLDNLKGNSESCSCKK